MSTTCVGDFRLRVGNWYVPNGKTPQECTYCEWCIRNGCININETTLLELDCNMTGCNCDCPKQADHPKLKFDCCIGSNPSNFATWYYDTKNENNDLACQYCFDNGCVDSDVYNRWDEKIADYKCTCKHQHPKVVGILCPICIMNRIVKPPTVQDNSYCPNCNMPSTKSGPFCTACSYLQKCCQNCGVQMGSGDTYIKAIQTILAEQKAKNQDNVNGELIKFLEENLEKIMRLYAGRTATEVTQILIDNARQ